MKNFYKISEVSKKYKTTNRQLRFYEEKQILKPAFVDENNGYRYYSEESCKELEKILCLKDIGFTLNDILSYLTSNNEIKKSILLKYYNSNQQENDAFTQLLNNSDYDLNFIEEIKYSGYNIKNKDLSKLKGVWTLENAYSNIDDVKHHLNNIDGYSPYQFLAFDENGNSPWFYTANDKKIVFNTFYLPCSENYQIIQNFLYLKISNYDQHIFGDNKKPIEKPHILVYKKFSNEYNDYIKFVHEDINIEEFILDKNIIGTWKTENNKFLIVEKKGTATLCSNKGIENLTWTKNCFYNTDLKVRLNYQIENNSLVLENKSKIYRFSGMNNHSDQFTKIIF